MVLIFGQDHLHQFGIGPVVNRSIFYFGEIIKSGRTLSGNIYTNHFLMGIDNTKHGLKLHKRHVASDEEDKVSPLADV